MTTSFGDRYDGSWKNGFKNGFGYIIFSDGDEYRGQWLNDMIVGEGKYFFVNGDNCEGTFLDGKLNGQVFLITVMVIRYSKSNKNNVNYHYYRAHRRDSHKGAWDPLMQ